MLISTVPAVGLEPTESRILEKPAIMRKVVKSAWLLALFLCNKFH